MGVSQGLTQKRFAELLTEAMRMMGWRGTELAQMAGMQPRTISLYRKPDYRHGPPLPKRRRKLEQLMGLPSGYLDGLVVVDFSEILRPGPIPKARETTRVFPSGAPRGSSATMGAPDNRWNDPSWAEEQFRSLVRNWERMVRGMTSEQGPDSVRQIRLTLIDMARDSARAAARPVPGWLTTIENEVIAGTFQ